MDIEMEQLQIYLQQSIHSPFSVLNSLTRIQDILKLFHEVCG
jgi:hypothetical protein